MGAVGPVLALAAGEFVAAKAAQHFAPGPPKPPPTVPMPDQSQLTQASQLEASKAAAARFGRAATVMTGTGAASVAGDKLGP